MMRDRRHLDTDARELVVPPDDPGSELQMIPGPKRFTLRANNSQLWISVRSNRMSEAVVFTDNAKAALAFSSAFAAVLYWRDAHPIEPLDEDGNINQPLAQFDLVIKEISG